MMTSAMLVVVFFARGQRLEKKRKKEKGLMYIYLP
jgi:hypothetical protein